MGEVRTNVWLRFFSLFAGTFAILVLASPPPAGAGWRSAPEVPVFTKQMEQKLARGVTRADRLGMRANVFAKVGDSNTFTFNQIYGLGCREPRLGRYFRLAPTIDRYNRITLPDDQLIPNCSPATSFSRKSISSRPFTDSLWPMTLVGKLREEEQRGTIPKLTDDSCFDQETPIGCEVRQIKPRFIFVQTGTNDRAYKNPTGPPAVRRFVRIVRHIRKTGSIPVLSTLPPMVPRSSVKGSVWSYVLELNDAIWRAGRITRTPVINLWSAMTRPGMIKYGISPTDTAHLGVYRGHDAADPLANSVIFSREALRYGVNRRNLLYLQTLRRLDSLIARQKTSYPVPAP